MVRFVKGDIVVVPFPYSDLTNAKRRPALVVTPLEGNDLILCQITSQYVSDAYAISIDDGDISEGKLGKQSHIRPNRLFTADHHIILYRLGNISALKMNIVIDRIIDIIKKK